jgi:hypothetical protein
MANAAVQRSYYSDTGSTAPRREEVQFPNFAKAYNEPERRWEGEVMRHLAEYAKMGQNWDSYGSPAVGWDTGMFALSVLNDVMRARTPIPQVVPSATGVQFEWHEKGVDLELHVSGPYQCEIWFQDHHRPQDPPISQELTDDFAALLKPIEILTNR